MATAREKAIREINSGIYCFDCAWLWPRLAALPVHPGATANTILTDMIAVAVAEHPDSVQTLCLPGMEEARRASTTGCNWPRPSASCATASARHWMREGVTMIDPAPTYIDAGRDAGPGHDSSTPAATWKARRASAPIAAWGRNARLVDAVVGDGCVVGASLLEGCTLEADVDVGSFNHLRRGAYLSSGVHLGNFAEVKNVAPGRRRGDGPFQLHRRRRRWARDTNIGAGTITANFDGAREKSTPDVGADVFLGSDTMLRRARDGRRWRATGAGVRRHQ